MLVSYIIFSTGLRKSGCNNPTLNDVCFVACLDVALLNVHRLLLYSWIRHSELRWSDVSRMILRWNIMYSESYIMSTGSKGDSFLPSSSILQGRPCHEKVLGTQNLF